MPNLAQDLQEAQPRQLAHKELLETPPRELDLEVVHARHLQRLGQRGVGLQQRGDLEVGIALLRLVEVLRLRAQVHDRLDAVVLLQPLPVVQRGVVWPRGAEQLALPHELLAQELVDRLAGVAEVDDVVELHFGGHRGRGVAFGGR